MPQGPPEDLAHARWRVRFFKHLVEEHRAHQLPQDLQWSYEDGDYASQLASAEEALSHMEASQTPALPTIHSRSGDAESAMDGARQALGEGVPGLGKPGLPPT